MGFYEIVEMGLKIGLTPKEIAECVRIGMEQAREDMKKYRYWK